MTLDLLDSNASATLMQPDRKCSVCKSVALEASYTFKTCPACREKSRNDFAKYRQRKKERAVLAAAGRVEPATDKVSKYKRKGKAQETFTPSATEYQGPNDLLASVKGKHTSGKLTNFEGCYRIVDLEQNHSSRVLDVALNLRDQTDLVFSPKAFKRTTNTLGTKFTSKFRCLCRQDASGLAPAPAPAKPKLTGDLKAWISGGRPSTDCGGVVSITACEDNSHNFLPGQKITIIVDHDS
ncbi:hypothetical protein BD626DRAFT_193348 [Schizophyllum amplum]|uniref:Uncharacterized protein n=1 Tax=Schizophyllum amplum TaxID=97359 RepID=A0A550CM50_9AGAR|nr:hypothetical protein BD626DRAFT_193348 [Auriculariopsis ampla]